MRWVSYFGQILATVMEPFKFHGTIPFHRRQVGKRRKENVSALPCPWVSHRPPRFMDGWERRRRKSRRRQVKILNRTRHDFEAEEKGRVQKTGEP